MTMRICIASINYEPEESGIAPYTTGMAVGLAARGHDVEVLTGLPHYPQWRVNPAYRGLSGTVKAMDGVVVRRFAHYVPAESTLRNRLKLEATFGVRAVSAGWNKPELVLTVSPSLIASAMVIARSRTANIPVGLIVQDLYGMGVVETGAMPARMAALAVRFEAAVLNHATGAAVVHDRFADAAIRMGVRPRRIAVIRNWVHIGSAQAVNPAEVRRRHGWQPRERIVLHSGNMGLKQGLENVVAAARLADERGVDIRFVLLGDGNQRKLLQQSAKDVQRLEFKDPLPADEYRQLLSCADVLLVNERPGVGQMAVPSKLTSYFSAGRPVLAATDANGVTAAEVRDSGAGVVISAGDPAVLLDTAVRLADSVEVGVGLGLCGQRYAQRLLGRERALDAYEAWCHRLTEGPRAAAPARRSDAPLPMTRPVRRQTVLPAWGVERNPVTRRFEQPSGSPSRH
ncbi:glycosyltransferase WbuB [Mycolicibacter terrae]|nr:MULTISPECIES: glycosyltransferase family 4 protein [Mycolicibacter]RRR43014.1 glycosyltransferase WbuB [Mycolicibacter terrae]